jgi:hypothetical protein
MRIVASAFLVFRERRRSDRFPVSGLLPATPPPDRPRNQPSAYPSGQRYRWGDPPTVSHGFAPAIGSDAYLGGSDPPPVALRSAKAVKVLCSI